MKKYICTFLLFPLLIACGGESQNNSANDNTEENYDTDTTATDEVEDYTVDIMLDKVRELPKECETKGKVVDAYTWQDKNGTNYFIRSMGEYEQTDSGDEYVDPVASQYLYAYHYAEDSRGTFSLLKEVTDFVKDCEFDVILGHELDGITLTDIDENDVAEITFIYRLACTSDLSPSTQKLIMLENGNKYPLRGSTQVMGEGGEYESGKEFDSAPAGFLEHAEKLWSENLIEYDFEL